MEVSAADRSRRVLPASRHAPGLHAGFWLRVAAWIIDQLILGPIITLVVGLVVALAVWPAAFPSAGFAYRYRLEALLWVWPVAFALSWPYYGVCESSRWQATPGKLMLGLRVTDGCGRRVGFARASGRWLGMLVSGAIAGVGYALAGWTRRKQALHDLMAGCCVVRGEGLDAWRSLSGARSMPTSANAAPLQPAGMPAWAIALLVFGIGVVVVLPFVVMLSAIAVPAYRAYRVRAEVAAGLEATARVRALVGEYIVQRGALPPNDHALGLPARDAVSARSPRSTRVVDGKVVVTYGHAADVRVRGGHLVLSPVGNAARLRWHCASPDIRALYLPRQCRD